MAPYRSCARPAGFGTTVLSYNDETKEGNGFTFLNYNAHDMLMVIRRALGFYRNKREIVTLLRKRGMRGLLPGRTAQGALDLYQKALGKE